jgi:hypothetical protein
MKPKPDMPISRAIVFFGLITSEFASVVLDVLVNASASFSATIQQELEILQSNPSPVEVPKRRLITRKRKRPISRRYGRSFQTPSKRSFTSGRGVEHEADGRQVDEGFRSLDLQLILKVLVCCYIDL